MSGMVTILLGGGTGSGKTLWAEGLAGRVPGLRVIGMDRYYRDLSDLPEAQRDERNFDAPESFDLELLTRHLRELRAGLSVELPVYDFRRHVRAPNTERLDPPEFLLLEGILALAIAELRECADLRLFMEVDEKIAYARRLERDRRERGRGEASVRAQYEATVRPMHAEHVWPSARFAHLLISGGGENRVALEIISAALRARATLDLSPGGDS